MKQDFVIKHGRTPDEVARVGEFLESIFGHGRDYLGSHPDVQAPECVRYMESDGQIVSAHVIERMELSFGDGWIPAARVELVATRESFRRQGLCRRLMEASIEWLKSEGTYVVVIFGEPLFTRLGFEYCIPSYELRCTMFAESTTIWEPSPRGHQTTQPPPPGLSRDQSVAAIT